MPHRKHEWCICSWSEKILNSCKQICYCNKVITHFKKRKTTHALTLKPTTKWNAMNEMKSRAKYNGTKRIFCLLPHTTSHCISYWVERASSHTNMDLSLKSNFWVYAYFSQYFIATWRHIFALEFILNMRIICYFVIIWVSFETFSSQKNIQARYMRDEYIH